MVHGPVAWHEGLASQKLKVMPPFCQAPAPDQGLAVRSVNGLTVRESGRRLHLCVLSRHSQAKGGLASRNPLSGEGDTGIPSQDLMDYVG
uniref:Uncharacterized protein n=1 Tax=Solanum tuberosum TaxID=4113 RepID=M1DHX4_SOLTU